MTITITILAAIAVLSVAFYAHRERRDLEIVHQSELVKRERDMLNAWIAASAATAKLEQLGYTISPEIPKSVLVSLDSWENWKRPEYVFTHPTKARSRAVVDAQQEPA